MNGYGLSSGPSVTAGKSGLGYVRQWIYLNARSLLATSLKTIWGRSYVLICSKNS